MAWPPRSWTRSRAFGGRRDTCGRPPRLRGRRRAATYQDERIRRFRMRIARLDHVRPAADRGARGKQHKARDLERRGAEKPARRQIFRHVAAGGFAQARERDVRGVFAPLRLKPDALHQPLLLGLHVEQRLRRRDIRHHRARLAAAERGQALHVQIEGAALDTAQQRGDLMRGHVVDVADEAQRQVIVLRIDPARARQAAAQRGERLSDVGRNFHTGEETRHWSHFLNGARSGITRFRYDPRAARTRATSASTCGSIRATITSTPAALGCRPST